MKIIIDLQGAQSTGSRNRGIGRYSLSITKAMLQNKRNHEIILVLSNLFQETIDLIKDEFEDYIDEKNIYVWNAPNNVSYIDTKNDTSRKNAEYIRETFLASLQPDIIFVTSLFEGLIDDAVTSINLMKYNIPTAVILYDLIPLINSSPYLDNSDVKRWYEAKIEHLKKANLLLSISESSKKEALDYLHFSSDNVINISTAADSQFKKIDFSKEKSDEILSRYRLTKSFLMYTGGIDHRKNIEGLIRSYALLNQSIRDEHQLAIVCSINDEQKEILASLTKSLGLQKEEVIFTDYIPEDDLIALYNLCKAFIFPSWHEGFGLPALEAMNCGAAVIASNRSSLPEVIGFNDALFNSLDDIEMSKKIEEVLMNELFRNTLISHGKEQIKKFSWESSAKKALDALENFIEKEESKSVEKVKSKLKLAYLSPLPPQKSGISDYSMELLPYLSQHYDIDIIVEDVNILGKHITQNYTINNIKYFEENAHQYNRILYHFGNSHFHKHMFNLLEKYPGTVVLHDFYLSHVIDSMSLLDQELYYSHGYKPFLHKSSNTIWEFPANKRVLDHAKGIIVHSNNSKKLANKWYSEDFSQHWITIPLLRVSATPKDKQTLKSEMGFAADAFIVSSFGLLGQTKENQKLLDAWLSSSLSKNKNSYLVFVGENDASEYGKTLLKTIEKSSHFSQIIITGWADTQTFKNHLSITDIGVQLRTMSRGETSATVLDCMNYAIPTIINANGSMADIDNNSVYKLQDEFTQQSLIQALEELYVNDTKRNTLGAKAQELILTKHKPEKCVNQYFQALENFYNKISNEKEALIQSIVNNDNNLDDNKLKQLAVCISNNHQYKGEKQLFVDVTQLVVVDSNSGIQRVVKSILNELLLNPPKGYRIEPVYSSIDNTGYKYAKNFTYKFLNIKDVPISEEVIDFKKDDIFLGLDLAQHIVISNKDYYKYLQAFGVKTYFIVYDLLPIFYDEYFPKEWLLKETHTNWLKVIKESNGAICISKAIENELKQWLQTNPSNNKRFFTNSFHLGANLENSKPTKGLLSNSNKILNFLSQRTSFLMVGTIEPRKSYNQTLEAFEELWRESIEVNLIIVGKKGWLVDDLIIKLQNHPELNKKLFWLEGISDEYLEKVYKNSHCLISASKAEGFGLPLIEAARYEIPIIARDIPVFKEVAKEFAYYFENTNEANVLCKAIKEWLELYKDDKHPKSQNMPWLTWQESTKILLDKIII